MFRVSLQRAPVLCWPMSWPLQFVLCYLVFQQFRMVVSRCDRQKAEVCECVSYMYFTFSQDIGAIRLAPCCGPSKRCEIFMIWKPHHVIWWKFPFKTLFYHFSYKAARARGIEKQTSDTNWIGTFPRPQLMNLSALSHITGNVLSTQRIWTLVYVRFQAASWQFFAPETARMQPRQPTPKHNLQRTSKHKIAKKVLRGC